MVSSAPLARRRNSLGAPPWCLPVLLALTLLTRLWILHPTEGEPDSALFSLGAWQWLIHGAHAVRIYDRWFSAGYYAFCGILLRLAHSQLSQVTGILNVVSLAAALATALLVWELGRRLVPPTAAFWAAVLFLLSPGIWQLGAEPHPEGLGIALCLAAFYCALRCGQSPGRGVYWWVAATLTLAAALLVRGDAVLLFPAFLAIWLLPGLNLAAAARRHAAFASLGVLIAATLIFLIARAALLGQSVAHTQHHAWSTITGYLGHLRWLHQSLPAVTALGPAVWIFTAAGVILLWRARPSPPFRLRWLLFALAWAAPGFVFWFLVRGNNVRHIAIYTLPWLWLACLGWDRAAARGRPARHRHWAVLATMAILALAVDAIAIPANSNLTLYPSGNVPASFALLRRQERQMRRLSRDLVARARAQPAIPVCYLGATTSPYVLLYSLEAATRRGLPWRLTVASPVTTLSMPSSAPLIFHDVYSPLEFRAARAACPQSFSLEYNAGGGHLWFFGQEWRNLPFHSRWYAARVPRHQTAAPRRRSPG